MTTDVVAGLAVLIIAGLAGALIRAIVERRRLALLVERARSESAATFAQPMAGDPDGLPGTAQDVTERRHAQEEREFQTALLATQQEASPDAILLVDPNGRILSFNQKFIELWGIDEGLARAGDDEPVLQSVVGQMEHPEAFLAKVRHLYEHKDEKSHDELETRDGRTIDRYSAPVTGTNGRFLGRVWYFRDVTERRRNETRLRESEQRFRQMAQTIGEVFWMASRDAASTLYVSPAFEAIWGRSIADLHDDPGLWLSAIHPDDLPHVLRGLEGLAEGVPYDIDYRIRRPDGEQRWINDRGYPLRDRAGEVVLTSGVATDVTRRKETEEAVRLSAKAFESIADGVIVTDANQRIVSVNPAFTSITGYAEAEILGRTPRFLQSGRHDAAFYGAMWEQIRRDGHWRGEIWDRRKDGEVYPELLSVSTVRDAAGSITHYVGVCTEISSLKEYEARLHHQAHHDALTGLPNRIAYQQRLAEALARARRHGHSVAVMLLDLDHFKTINDSLGHAAGDALLETVATRLQAGIRETDTLPRFGGDEFAVLLDSVRDGQAAARVARTLLEALSQPYQVAGQEFSVTASIGVTCYPQDGLEPDLLFKNADVAMYRAKTEGRNRYQFFSEDMNERALETLVMANSLRLALKRGELLLHYQPLHDLSSGRPTGVEALVRWQHPELGLVPPARFIPVAEETGLIEAIGEWVLRAACKQMRAWLDRGLPLARIAVNLSARQFRNPDLVERITVVLAETGLPARHLELEVTESMVMEKPEDAARVLARLKAMGITIAIDDFGTGYSSLSYLKRLPIDRLKIDRSFVHGIPKEADDVAIIKAIISMAKSLKLRLVAEGIETPGQRLFLELEGCDEGQGFLFARPVPAREIEGLIGISPGSIVTGNGRTLCRSALRSGAA
jgi:diguanylate cyclase (GGDEF)-like protein/PAS domain S-box-containing protein